MTTCSGCFERFPQLEADKLCGKCQRISDAKNDVERQKAKMLEKCENCGAAGLSITTPCPLCRGGGPEDVTASVSASSLLQKAEEHKAKASGLRLNRKAPTTEEVKQARADAKELAKKERVMFQWTMYYKAVDSKGFTDTSNLPEGKEFAVSTTVCDIINHITKSVETAWSSAALAHLRLRYGCLDKRSTIEFALANPGGKGVGVKFGTDAVWNSPLKAVLPMLSQQFQWHKHKDHIVYIRAVVRLPLDSEEIAEDLPKTRSARKRKTRSVDSVEDAEIAKPTTKRISSASSSSLFSTASFFSIFSANGTVDRRSFKKLDIEFELDAGGQYQEKLRSGREMEVVELLDEPKMVGGFKGCFPARYDGGKVAICIAEGMADINYSEEDNERFVFSEAKALSMGRCLAQRFYEELEVMAKEDHYPKGYNFSKFTFNDGFVADFGESALTTDSYMRDTPKKVARRYALVSPMLPNWPKPFLKFAGARGEFTIRYDPKEMGKDIKEPIFNELRVLLETFVHYTWVRSGQAFIFADLQGAWSRDREIFILADPQLHTSTNNGKNLAPVASWDSKMDGIASYFASHTCDRTCDYLNLTEVRFVNKPAKRSAGLENLLNDVNRSPKARGARESQEPAASVLSWL